MKKTIYMLALVALALSCAKEIDQNSAVGGKKVTITVGLSDAEGTKVSLTEASDKKSMSLAWEASDAISINGETFTIKEGFSAHEAEFEGNAPSGDSYTIIYPGKYSSAEAFNARSYVSQTQTGNSSTAHLEYNAMLSGVTEYATPKFDPDWASDKGGSLTQNGVLQLRLQLPESPHILTTVALLASRAIFPTTNEGTDKVAEQKLGLSSVSLGGNNILEAYMMFSAAGVEFQDGDKLTVLVETNEALYIKELTMTAQTWTGGGQYTIQCKLVKDGFDIETADDLEEFRDGVNSGSLLWQRRHVKLKNDIDCSSITSWTPIGNGTFTPFESGAVSATWEEPAFKGTFDGQNHAIKNLKMEASPESYHPYGLFGILYQATVQHLILGAESGDTGKLDVTPVGRMDAGAVAGVSYGSTILDVTNYYPMTIPSNSSPNRVAMGMVGYVYGDNSGISELTSLNNYGAVTAEQSSANTTNGALSVQVAGIAGFSNTGGTRINTITACNNYGEITASTARCAGILAAANTRTTIEACNNRGNIKNTWSSTSRVGGITVITAQNCAVKSCHNYNRIEVTSSGANAGGIICLVNHATSEVESCTNEGTVTGETAGASYLGGIVSRIYAGTVTGCINTGDISGSAKIGGIVGGLGNNSAFPHVEKCRSNAAIKATLNLQDCVGGIVGEMYSGILNTCSAKGSVTGAGYDIGGIVGLMYCTNDGGTYGRQYVYDCLAANDVTCTRANAGGGNMGGVVGRMIRHKNITGQFVALDNCIGLNQKITDSGAGNHTFVGAFVGQVTANVQANYNRVRVRNNISLVEDSNFTATGTANVGGFVGGMPYGYMAENYYLVSTNHQTIGGSGNASATNVTQSTLANLTSATFCESFSTSGKGYDLTLDDVTYKTSGWEIPDGVSYPVPSTLAALGSEYYK